MFGCFGMRESLVSARTHSGSPLDQQLSYDFAYAPRKRNQRIAYVFRIGEQKKCNNTRTVGGFFSRFLLLLFLFSVLQKLMYKRTKWRRLAHSCHSKTVHIAYTIFVSFLLQTRSRSHSAFGSFFHTIVTIFRFFFCVTVVSSGFCFAFDCK